METQDKQAQEQGTVVELDGVAKHVSAPRLTGAELMRELGVDNSTGLLEILEDNTQSQVKPDEQFDLEEREHRFKRRPKFKRG